MRCVIEMVTSLRLEVSDVISTGGRSVRELLKDDSQVIQAKHEGKTILLPVRKILYVKEIED